MPNIQSKKKNLRKTSKHQAYNRAIKSKIKTVGNKIDALVEEKKVDEASVVLAYFYKIIDKASVKGVIKKQTVARKKSKITKRINSLKTIK